MAATVTVRTRQTNANKPKYEQSARVKKLYQETRAANKNRPGDYAESQRVKDLYGQMQAFDATKPGEYQSRFTEKIDGVLDRILNRETFSYDMNADPLYQQYKEQYTKQGQQAMKDVIGNAAALTGGYGNSYAATVGSQAYQQYMGQMNDKALDLYQIAYQKYMDEGSNMHNQLGALQSVDGVEYGRYQDKLAQWNTDRDYYTGLYQNERDFDYGTYRGLWDQYNEDRSYAAGMYQNERNFNYGQYQDRMSQWNTDRAFTYQQEQDAQAQANWAAEFAYQKQKDAADRAYQYAALNARGNSGSSRSSSSSSGDAPTTYSPLSTQQVSEYQNEIDGLSPSQAQSYIKMLYESGKISKSQASALYEYNTGTAAKRAADPMSAMSRRGSITL